MLSVHPRLAKDTMDLSNTTTLLPPAEHNATGPAVSIVVCTYNRAPQLAQTLASLVHQRARGRSYEIVVVDDGSTDKTQDIVQRERGESDIEIRYIRQSNEGIGSARNCGVLEARAPWIAFIDDDELADENWLHELLTTAEASGADCVGGPSILKSIEPTAIEPVGTVSMLLGQNPAMMANVATRSMFDRLRSRVTRVTLPGGGNALIRRALVQELGGFRPITYGEDFDLFRRAERRGARFAIAPQAKVYHLIPPQRFTSEYLYNEARRGGTTRAGMDKERSRAGACVTAVLRLIHMCVITLPSLVWYFLLGRKNFVASCRCSAWFATAYIRGVMQSRDAT